MSKKHWCSHCNSEVSVSVRKTDTTVNVYGKRKITVNSDVCFCKRCGREVCDNTYDDATLQLAYAEYERQTGEKVTPKH